MTTNPKDLLGSKKVSITCVPPIAIVHEAEAMMDGAAKYGKFNWRQHPVIASIYIDALLRHVFSWLEGERFAPDSKAHHLGHARACLGILLDAEETGNLIDDRCNTESSLEALQEVMGDIQKKLESAQQEKLVPLQVPEVPPDGEAVKSPSVLSDLFGWAKNKI